MITNNMNIDINMEYYRVFYYVALYQSFSKAAEYLRISQPAVSKTIQSLERLMQCKLFARSVNGTVLTEEGKALFTYVEKAYSFLRQGENLIQRIVALDEGQICIGASDMTLRFFLLERIERFCKMYPHIHVRITNVPTPSTLDALAYNQIDFGVISTQSQFDYNAVSTIEVMDIEDVFIVGEKYFDIMENLKTRRAMVQHPIICLEKGTSTRAHIDQYFQKDGIALLPELELSTSEMIVEFTKRNFGIGCVVKPFADDMIADGAVKMIQLKEEIETRKIMIIYDRNKPLSNAVKAFFKLI